MERQYRIREQTRLPIPLPFDSPAKVAVHLIRWACWLFYCRTRLLQLTALTGVRTASTVVHWVLLLCEIAMMMPEVRLTLLQSFPLLADRPYRPRLSLRLEGEEAPMVHIFVTYEIPRNTRYSPANRALAAVARKLTLLWTLL
jgi:hypothetical protein